MVGAIRRCMPGARVRVPNGGYFLWVELPEHIDSDEVVRCAAKVGVAIFSGKASFAEAPPQNFLRLAYSYCTPARIAEGIELVGRGYRALLAESEAPASRVATR
jgi:2-aminoadipate transaminase